MSLPPPPDSYGGQPPDGGHPQWAGLAPGAGEGQFSGPPLWGPPPQQPQWGGPPPGPPPSKGGKGKWVLGGVIVLLVVALAVTVTILVTGDGSNQISPKSPGDGQASEFASANDTGPVNIITEDPTCDAWGRVVGEYSNRTDAVGWGDRDPSVAASAWTPQQRSMYESVRDAQQDAVSKTERLAKQTPHRVIRELYGQFGAYSEAFVASIPLYVPGNDNLAVEADTIASALSNVCSAITVNSAAPLAGLIQAPQPPTSAISDGPQNGGQRFVIDSNDLCSEWIARADQFSEQTAEWQRIGPNLSAADWTPEQRAAMEDVSSVMLANASDMERAGRRSGNVVFEDFAVLAAQYQRAYVEAIPSFTFNDSYVMEAATYLANTVYWGCKAAPK